MTREQAQSLADELGIKYIETSAKHNIAIKQAFQDWFEQTYKYKLEYEINEVLEYY